MTGPKDPTGFYAGEVPILPSADNPLPEQAEAPTMRYADRYGVCVAEVVVPTIRWLDSQERDLFLSQRRAKWSWDGRKR